MNTGGANGIGTEDSKEVAAAAIPASKGDAAALHSLRRAVWAVERDVRRRFGKLRSVDLGDAADNAFIYSVRTYDPERGGFTGHFRRNFYTACLDRVKQIEGKFQGIEPVSLDSPIEGTEGGITYIDAIEDRDLAGAAEMLVDIARVKEFFVMAIGYLYITEIRVLQAIIRGQSFAEAAKIYRVSPQMISKNFGSVVRFAQIFERGEVPWPPTEDSLREVRHKIVVESYNFRSQSTDDEPRPRRRRTV